MFWDALSTRGSDRPFLELCVCNGRTLFRFLKRLLIVEEPAIGEKAHFFDPFEHFLVDGGKLGRSKRCQNNIAEEA